MSQVALPDALKARRKKLEAEHGSADPAPAGDDTPAPAPATAEQEPPESTGKDDEAGATDAAGEDMLDDTDSDFLTNLERFIDPPEEPSAPAPATAPSADAAWQMERQRLLEEKQMLEAELERERASRGAATVPELQVPELNAQDLARYQSSRPAVEHIALEAMAKQMNPILADLTKRLSALEGSVAKTEGVITNVEKSARKATDASFTNIIATEIGNVQAILKSPNFEAFLSRRPQYMPNTTLRALLSQAMKERNAPQVVSILRAFIKTEEARGNRIEGLRSGRPSGTGGRGVQNELPNGADSGRLKFSERRQAWDDFRMGRISREKFDEIKAKYEAASAKGLVDYDT